MNVGLWYYEATISGMNENVHATGPLSSLLTQDMEHTNKYVDKNMSPTASRQRPHVISPSIEDIFKYVSVVSALQSYLGWICSSSEDTYFELCFNSHAPGSIHMMHLWS